MASSALPIVLIFCLEIFSTCSLHIPLSYKSGFQGRISVTVSYEDISTTKRSLSTLPKTLSTTLKFNGDVMTLHLISNDKLVSLPPVFQTVDGNVVQKPINALPRTQRYYQDTKRHASLYVECSQYCRKHSITGTFVFRNETYLITPSSSASQADKTIVHEISKPDTTKMFGNDYKLVEDPSLHGYQNQNEGSRQSKMQKKRNMSRRQKRATGQYPLELFLVTDYSVFKFWMDESGQNRTTAIDRLSRYYAFMINGIDVRYSNLPNASFSIDIVYVGLYISETTVDSFWTERNKFILPSGETRIQMDITLAIFSNWIQQRIQPITHLDHAMLFTKYNLANGTITAVTGKSECKGFAYFGAICSPLSQSVVEENFNYISQTVAAHELGHSLGAVHDGEQNGCNISAAFIMSPSSEAQLGDRAKNPWMFSACSVTEIQTTIDKLNNQGSNCMLNEFSGSIIDIHPYLTKPIGQEFGIDKQCQIVFGSSSYANRVLYKSKFSVICTGLWCWTGSSYKLMIPADGTSCGNNKWCDGPLCVSNSNAPSIDETCSFGDTPYTPINEQTCETFVKKQPWQCYNEDVYNTCCQSCSAYKINDTGCSFGDFGDCSSLSKADCYLPSNQKLCCGFCRKQTTDIPDCKYGDLTSGCIPSLCPYYAFPTQCCETCYPFFTTTKAPLTTVTTKMTGVTVIPTNTPTIILTTSDMTKNTPTTTTITTTSLSTTASSTTRTPTTTSTTTTLSPATTTSTTSTLSPTTTTSTTSTLSPTTTTSTTSTLSPTTTTSTTSTLSPTTTANTTTATPTTTTSTPTTLSPTTTTSTTSTLSPTTTTSMTSTLSPTTTTSTTTTSSPTATGTTTTLSPTTTKSITTTLSPTTTSSTTTNATVTTTASFTTTTPTTSTATTTNPTTTTTQTTSTNATTTLTRTTANIQATTANPTTTATSKITTSLTTITAPTKTNFETTTTTTTTFKTTTTTQTTTILKTSTTSTTPTGLKTSALTTASLPTSKDTPSSQNMSTYNTEPWIVPVVAVLATLCFLCVVVICLVWVIRRKNRNGLLLNTERSLSNFTLRGDPKWTSSNISHDNKGYIADESPRNVVQTGTYIRYHTNYPTNPDNSQRTVHTTETEVSDPITSFNYDKDTHVGFSVPDKPSKRHRFVPQQSVISEATENITIENDETEMEDARSENSSHSNSSKKVRIHDKPETKKRRFEKNNKIIQKSLNGFSQEKQAKLVLNERIPGTSQEIHDHNGRLSRQSSDSIIEGSMRDRRLELRDKWLREQQIRKVNQNGLYFKTGNISHQQIQNVDKHTNHRQRINIQNMEYETLVRQQPQQSHQTSDTPMINRNKIHVPNTNTHAYYLHSYKRPVFYAHDGQEVVFIGQKSLIKKRKKERTRTRFMTNL